MKTKLIRSQSNSNGKLESKKKNSSNFSNDADLIASSIRNKDFEPFYCFKNNPLFSYNHKNKFNYICMY